MALSDIYMVKHFQDFEDQQCLNVYFYELFDGVGGAIPLSVAWQETILPAVNQAQSSNVRNVSLDVINLGDTTDFDSVAVVGGGALAAESLPAFNALSYTFKSDDRAVRHGGKRYVGVPESTTLINDIVDPTYLGYMEDLRIALFGNVVGTVSSWRPVLIKRIKTAIPDTSPEQFTYRLPTTGDPLTVAGLLSVLVSNKVRHQTSRQT